MMVFLKKKQNKKYSFFFFFKTLTFILYLVIFNLVGKASHQSLGFLTLVLAVVSLLLSDM